MKDELLTIEDVCEIMDVSKITLMKYEKSGKIPKAKRITRKCIRWSRNQILSFLNDK